MDQLVVLQEIHSSLSNGRDGLQQIDSSTIKGCCPELMGKLLEGSRNGRIDEAVCRELSEKLQNVYELKRLGDICRRAGLHPLATTTYNRALSICQDPVLRPVLQNNLGQSHASQGDLARAAFYYHKAAEVFQREGDHASLAHVLGNLGSAYRQNMEWDKAIEHCYRSLKTFEEAGDPRGVAQMSASIGRIYADLGERELASRYFEKSLADFRELGDQKSQAWIQDRLGRIAEERMEWDHAINCYQSSISIFEERGEYGNIGVVLSNMGRTFLKMNDPSSAREPLERAVSIISRQAGANYLNALFSLAKTYNSLAEIRLQEAEMQEAETQEEVMQEAKAPEAGMLKALASEEEADDGFESCCGEKLKAEAASLFSQAADRYKELSKMITDGKKEIRTRAALAKGRSYLARLEGQNSDQDAFFLFEKAQALLDESACNASDERKGEIIGLQRIVSGMNEAYGLDASIDDIDEQISVLCSAAESLVGGAHDWDLEISGGHLSQAIGQFRSAIELKGSGRDFGELLQASRASLLSAREHFDVLENSWAKASSRKIARAAEILDGLKSQSKMSAGWQSPEDDDDDEEQSSQNKISQSKIDYDLERAALVAIAGALMTCALGRIEEGNDHLSWDESARLQSAPEGQTPVAADEADGLQAEPDQGSATDGAFKDESLVDGPGENDTTDTRTIESLQEESELIEDGPIEDEPVEDNPAAANFLADEPVACIDQHSHVTSSENGRAKCMILADGSIEAPSASVILEEPHGNPAKTGQSARGWILSVNADEHSKAPEQLLQSDCSREPIELPFESRSVKQPESVCEMLPHQEMKPQSPESNTLIGEEQHACEDSDLHAQKTEDFNEAFLDAGDGSFEQGQKPPIDNVEDAGSQFHEAPPSPEIESDSGELQKVHPKLMLLLKAMTALVAILLAIEVMLYLI